MRSPNRAKTTLAIALAAVLSLIVAGSAHAYEWQIAKKVLPSLGISKEATSNSGGAFELSVPSLSLTIKCSSESGSGEIVKGGTASASMTFTGCVVSGAEKVCAVQTPGKAAGTLAGTITTKFLETEVGGVEKFYDEVTPSITAAISGALCPLAEVEGTTSGTTAAEVPSIGEETVKRTMKFSKASAEKSGVKGLTFGGEPAFLIGESTTELAGAQAGQQQAVTPIKFNPAPVAFAGTGGANSKMVTISNDGFFRRIKLKQIGITGPYGLADPNGCEGKVLLVAPNNPNSCVVTITCNERKPGVHFVKFDVLNAGGAVVGLGISEVDMTC